MAKRIAGRERQVGLLFFFSEFERWREIQISSPTNQLTLFAVDATLHSARARRLHHRDEQDAHPLLRGELRLPGAGGAPLPVQSPG